MENRDTDDNTKEIKKQVKLGYIQPDSIQRVRLVVRGAWPKAVTAHWVRKNNTTIGHTNMMRVLQYLADIGDVEHIDTTSGPFWKWVKHHGD